MYLSKKEAVRQCGSPVAARRARHGFRWMIATPAAVLALSLICGCGKPAATHHTVEKLQASETVAESSPSFTALAPAADEPTPAPPTVIMIPQPEPPPDARTLEQRYFAATDAAERAEIAGELFDLNTPEAATTARRLFSVEGDEDVKLVLLTELAQMDSPTEREQNFGIFVTALFPTQSRTIRETAISLLASFGDARAVQVLRNLSKDPDAEIREAAAEAVRELQEAN